MTRLKRTGIIAAFVLLAGEPSAGGEEESRLIYVPTPQVVVNYMLELADVTGDDVFYDLGSGDGRFVITAAKEHEAEAVGVDLDPERIKESLENAEKAGVEAEVTFRQQDLFETDLSDATVVALYLLPETMDELRSKLADELKPGAVIVAHDFKWDDWEPDRTLRFGKGAMVSSEVDPSGDQDLFEFAPDAVVWDRETEARELARLGQIHTVYYWVVPARVGGTWEWTFFDSGGRAAVEADFEQDYQKLDGSVRWGEQKLSLRKGRVNGTHLRFELRGQRNGEPVAHHFHGTMKDETIEGTLTSLKGDRIEQQQWRAERVIEAGD